MICNQSNFVADLQHKWCIFLYIFHSKFQASDTEMRKLFAIE
ncbi:hypothetical protein AS4_07760 [Acinetobacter guillouiae]|nr:hypothetical protein AS4_07760 [Acinetobacter guillouiae]